MENMENKKNMCSCPLCGGRGALPEGCLDATATGFLKNAIKDPTAYKPFFEWAVLVWNTAHKEDKDTIQLVQKQFGGFKEELRREMKSSWDSNIEQVSALFEGDTENKEELNQTLEKMRESIFEYHFKGLGEKLDLIATGMTKLDQFQELRDRMRQAEGRDMEKSFFDLFDEAFPHWETTETGSRVGDLIVRPRVMNGNNDYEPADQKVLIEYTEKPRVGKADLDKLFRNMRRRDTEFGLLVVSEETKTSAKYRDRYWIKQYRVAMATRENFKPVCCALEAVMAELHKSGKKPKDIDPEKIQAMISSLINLADTLETKIKDMTVTFETHVKSYGTRLNGVAEDHSNRLREIARYLVKEAIPHEGV